MNTAELPKSFEPHALEQGIYELWESSGYFEPSGIGDGYCIVIPPPNVTGSLHMGHAFQDTIMDAVVEEEEKDEELRLPVLSLLSLIFFYLMSLLLGWTQ